MNPSLSVSISSSRTHWQGKRVASMDHRLAPYLLYETIVCRLHVAIFVVSIKTNTTILVYALFILLFCVNVNPLISYHWYLRYVLEGPLAKASSWLPNFIPSKRRHNQLTNSSLCFLSSQACDLLRYRVCSNCLCSSMYGITPSACWKQRTVPVWKK